MDINESILSPSSFLWGKSNNDLPDNDMGFDIEKTPEGKFRVVLLNDPYNDDQIHVYKIAGEKDFNTFNEASSRLNEILNRDLYRQYDYKLVDLEETGSKYETVVKAKKHDDNPVSKEQEERSKLDKPDTKHEEQTAPAPAEQKADDRAEFESPLENEEEPDEDNSTLGNVEKAIKESFRPGHEGVQKLKEQLEEQATDDGSWFLPAIGATLLDIADTAMSITEGMPLGMLDTRNIGEGLAEGTWEGAKKDISRALNVLPQGRILKAVDRAITALDVIESLQKGDVKSAALQTGMGALAVKKGTGKAAKSALGKALSKTKGSKKVKIDPESTSHYKTLENTKTPTGQPKIKQKQMNSQDSAWARYQKIISGKDHEYRASLNNGKTVDIDGLGTTRGQKLVLKEAKLGFKKNPVESGHLLSPAEKMDLIERYVAFMKENPNQISHVEIHYNIATVGEIYHNIVHQNPNLSIADIAKIHFVYRPFGNFK